MESILEKVDLDTYEVYNIKINIEENDTFTDEDDGEFDEHGQCLGATASIRRKIKSSDPLESKKIIKSIDPKEEKEDEHGEACRDIELEYYILVDKEEADEFSMDELSDVLEEEWQNGSASCSVSVSVYES